MEDRMREDERKQISADEQAFIYPARARYRVVNIRSWQ